MNPHDYPLGPLVVQYVVRQRALGTDLIDEFVNAVT
jgi:hypothetical protein